MGCQLSFWVVGKIILSLTGRWINRERSKISRRRIIRSLRKSMKLIRKGRRFHNLNWPCKMHRNNGFLVRGPACSWTWNIVIQLAKNSQLKPTPWLSTNRLSKRRNDQWILCRLRLIWTWMLRNGSPETTSKARSTVYKTIRHFKLILIFFPQKNSITNPKGQPWGKSSNNWKLRILKRVW